MQIALGLFIEFEHKVKILIGKLQRTFMLNEHIQWVRMTIIYVVGVISGSLFHSVANPCIPLVGASGGIYALFGESSRLLVIQYLAFSRHKNLNLDIRCWYNQIKTT